MESFEEEPIYLWYRSSSSYAVSLSLYHAAVEQEVAAVSPENSHWVQSRGHDDQGCTSEVGDRHPRALLPVSCPGRPRVW